MKPSPLFSILPARAATGTPFCSGSSGYHKLPIFRTKSLHVTSTVVPAVGSSFELLDNEAGSAIGGVFAGLSEGSTFTVTVGTTTMTFQVTYAGKDGDGKHNVVITRTA
jgi:hypothetical protein